MSECYETLQMLQMCDKNVIKSLQNITEACAGPIQYTSLKKKQ